MLRRIFIVFIVLGSIGYGWLAVRSAGREWRALPSRLAVLGQQTTPLAIRQAQYLRSVTYQGQLVLAVLAGLGFLAGACGVLWRRPWGSKTLFGGAWLAFAHLAWVLIASLEWFRATGTGMLYQIHVLNVAWVLLVLAVAPTERLIR